ncbi:shikimate kinase [Tenuifilum thalassicum]|uniref:Shikimate kinase n=1 Tax=Tenuifilum thalassicum TaxID=2590900 RepID=A0A7D4BAA2_9BACT|nr:shikimate kinase [Tenuifilum thalassicum]QKG79260.1 shikimate kinase [Tenuifilum thalassicum]
MKIFLIGFMGSGKSTVGVDLAHILGYRFIDLDEYIEQKHNLSIKLIFETKGEDYFRMIENETLKEVCSFEGDFVISSGGGTSCFYNNIDYMNRNGITVYLRAEVSTLVARLIESKVDRPLLWGKTKDELNEYIIRVLNERKKYYEKAQVIIDADNANPKDLAQLIISTVNI